MLMMRLGDGCRHVNKDQILKQLRCECVVSGVVFLIFNLPLKFRLMINEVNNKSYQNIRLLFISFEVSMRNHLDQVRELIFYIFIPLSFTCVFFLQKLLNVAFKIGTDIFI